MLPSQCSDQHVSVKHIGSPEGIKRTVFQLYSTQLFLVQHGALCSVLPGFNI